jgi:hypothetical protein
MAIKWNKVTWYSKLIALIIFVGLPFVGFYYGTQYGETIAFIGQTPAITSSVQTSVGAGVAYDTEWEINAESTGGGFGISYPIDFDAQYNDSMAESMDWRVNANNVSGVKYFTLTVPKTFEPQTNFVDATLTVGASANSVAVSQCMTPDQSGGPTTAVSTATVNGITFSVFRSSDAGAGNIYETTSYRALHAGKCYAVEYTVHSAELANYPASYGYQQFNEVEIDSLMQSMVGTFKFL